MQIKQSDTTRYDYAILFSRITFPYLLLMSVTALIGGVLNAHAAIIAEYPVLMPARRLLPIYGRRPASYSRRRL